MSNFLVHYFKLNYPNLLTSVNLLIIFSFVISHMKTPCLAVAPHIQLTSPVNDKVRGCLRVKSHTSMGKLVI